MTETKGWAILTPRGAYVDGTAFRKKEDSWWACQMESGCHDRRQLRKDGYRAVKVRIAEA